MASFPVLSVGSATPVFELASEVCHMQVQVLVVDDDITLRTLLVMQLDKLGIQAECASNGKEALQCVQTRRYALILMDIQMPEMNGTEAAESIRLYEREHGLAPVPILALSGQSDRKTAIAAGMNDFAEKPIQLDTLEMLVKRWMKPLG